MFVRTGREIQINPAFHCLSSQQVRQTHKATLEVLERTGVDVYNEAALALLQRAGAQVTGVRVRFPSALVEWAISSAPESITIWSRDGVPTLQLSGRNVYFGPGPSCPNILDVYTGERRLVLSADLEDYARLCDALPNLDFMMSMGILAEEAESSDVQEFAAMILNTKKPIVAWSWNEEGAQDILDMALPFRKGLDDLRQRPNYIFYCEPTSPLRHTDEALRKLLFTAERGLPLIYGSGPVGGASAPVTIEGMVVTGNAEVLSGLVIAQLQRSGTPFIFGTGTGPLDMASMTVAYGAPEFILGQAVLAELARFYGLPSWGFGGCSESKLPDEQTAIQSALWNLLSSLAGANLVHDVGFIESGLTGSMEALVMNNEIIGMVKRLLGGIGFSKEDFGLEVTGLTDRSTYENWVAQGKTTMGWRAREKAKELLGRSPGESKPEQDVIQQIIDRARLRTSKQR